MSNNIKEKEVIKVKITGIQKYGAFATIENNDYSGLIHISEISYGYVKNIHVESFVMIIKVVFDGVRLHYGLSRRVTL